MTSSDAYAHSQLKAGQLAWIAAQRPTARLDDDVFVCHGSPRSDLEYFLESVDARGLRPASLAGVDERLGDAGGRLVACGHTHVPRVVRASRGTLVVNPGSVGLQAFGDDRHDSGQDAEHHRGGHLPPLGRMLIRRVQGNFGAMTRPELLQPRGRIMTDKATASQAQESNTIKDPDHWTTGDEPMTGAQRSYLTTLSEEAKVPFDEGLSKADASKRIDELQQQTGRGLPPT